MPIPANFTNSITQISQIGNHTVFVLATPDGTFAVKFEVTKHSTKTSDAGADWSERMKQSFKVMWELYRRVLQQDPALPLPDIRVLGTMEEGVVLKWLSTSLPTAHAQVLQDASGGTPTFAYAMEYVDPLLHLEKPRAGLGTPADQQQWKDVRKKALGLSTYRQLGRIAAVDLFIGNTDRFNAAAMGKEKFIQHPGNILFTPQCAMPLDFFDPNSGYSDLFTAISPEQHAPIAGTPWVGEYMQNLGDDAKVTKFAEGVVNEIDAILSLPANAKMLMAENFGAGFLSGMNKIRQVVADSDWSFFNLPTGSQDPPRQLKFRVQTLWKEKKHGARWNAFFNK